MFSFIIFFFLYRYQPTEYFRYSYNQYNIFKIIIFLWIQFFSSICRLKIIWFHFDILLHINFKIWNLTICLQTAYIKCQVSELQSEYLSNQSREILNNLNYLWLLHKKSTTYFIWCLFAITFIEFIVLVNGDSVG